MGNDDCSVRVACALPCEVAGKLMLPDTPDAIVGNVTVAFAEPSNVLCVCEVGTGEGVGVLGMKVVPVPPELAPPPPPPHALSRLVNTIRTAIERRRFTVTVPS